MHVRVFVKTQKEIGANFPFSFPRTRADAHRNSEDIDFFSPMDFKKKEIKNKKQPTLKKMGKDEHVGDKRK